MFNEEGGVGTTSSSVRRARFSFGALTGTFAVARLFTVFPADRFAARRLGRLAERAFDFRALPAEARLARRADFRFAMRNVLSNLDSLSISVVRSVAYRNSEKPCGEPAPAESNARPSGKWNRRPIRRCSGPP